MPFTYLGDEYDDDDAVYLQRLMDEEGIAEYDPDDYTGRPVEESGTRVGEAHHPDCPDSEAWECCKAYWLADYELRTEREAEELHQEWWQ